MKNRLNLLLLILIFSHASVNCQVTDPSQPQKKVALVIGNGNYASSVLANPENDAKSMKGVLQRLGFTVYEYENLNQSQMKKAIDDFGVKLKGNDVGLFYYAGHGIQAKGYNFLIPVDAQIQSENEVEYDCVQADRILAKMETAGTKVNILILDACRNNPFERSWTRSATGRGLAFMNAPAGTLIAYATSPGSTASDGSGYNGLYTAAILESILIPNITILEMFQNVRSIVSQKSNKQQIPWESTSLTGNFYFYIAPSSTIDNIPEPAITAPPEKAGIPATNTNPVNDPNNNSQNSINTIRNSDNISLVPNDLSKAANNDFFTDPLDKQQYKTVKIGDQIWMAENLKTSTYNDGSVIPLVTNNTTWINMKTPGYCWYNNDEVANKAIYGALYNWFAVNTGKLCPTGWHVPTNEEWTTLINYLGGLETSGGKLKEFGVTHWNSPNIGATNESGFSSLPGGYRNLSGIFYFLGNYGYWWSSTEVESNYAWYRSLNYNTNKAYSNNLSKMGGFSVRCIRN